MKRQVSLPTSVEEAYAAAVSVEHRKRLGQFFTPAPIADFLAKWIVGNAGCRTILDPAVGLGALLQAVRNQPAGKSYVLRGYDVDPVVLEHAARVLAANDQQIQLWNEDYLRSNWQQRYDGIICNPPYLKFQRFKDRTARLQELQAQLGHPLSGLTNMYTLFLLKSIHQLTDEGRAAFIVPSEFLNADYGTTIKKLMLVNKTLRYVILFNPNYSIFDQALTTTCILLFANDSHTTHTTFINIESIEQLSELTAQVSLYPNSTAAGRTVRHAELNYDVKWRAYYQHTNNQNYKNVVPLLTYGKVMRGIATGDNAYFGFNQHKRQQFSIPDAALLPCITKTIHVQTSFFTPQHFSVLQQQSKSVFLLNATGTLDPSVQAYITHGEALGVHKRHLTSHRKPWFILEQRLPAPILITAFSRNKVRFVRNEALVRNLTCFHGFYARTAILPRIDVLMAYLLTDTAHSLLHDQLREYGGGLKKFEPNDLNHAYVIDLSIIDAETEQIILRYYQDYRASVLDGQPNEFYLDELNTLFARLLLP